MLKTVSNERQQKYTEKVFVLFFLFFFNLITVDAAFIQKHHLTGHQIIPSLVQPITKAHIPIMEYQANSLQITTLVLKVKRTVYSLVLPSV